MGRTTPLHVEVTGKIDETGGIMLPDTLWREVEVAKVGEPLVTDLGNGNKELRQEVILQAFDSGLYTLPPVLFVQDGQVTESNRPALKVMLWWPLIRYPRSMTITTPRIRLAISLTSSPTG